MHKESSENFFALSRKLWQEEGPLRHKLVYAHWSAPEFFEAVTGALGMAIRAHASTRLLEQRLRNIFGVDEIFLFNRGRTGLKVALRNFALTRPDRNEVVFPSYICPAVYQTIKESGLQPIPVDINTDLNINVEDVERGVTSRTLAVIAAHMYGAPAAVDRLEQLCRNSGVFLVDDAAQVVGVELCGRALGTFGDCGILSFGQSKTVVAGGGGVLLLRNGSLRTGIQNDWKALEPEPFKFSELANLLVDIIWQTHTKELAYYARKLMSEFGALGSEKDVGPYALNDVRAAIALHQFESVKARVAGRTRVVGFYNKYLGSEPRVRLIQYAPDRYLRRVMIAVRDVRSVSPLRSALAARSVQTRLGYEPNFDNVGELPHFQSIKGRLLELPSHSKMREHQVKGICALLTDALNEVGLHDSLEQANRKGSTFLQVA